MSIRATIYNALVNPDTRLLGQIQISEDDYKELIEYTRYRVLKNVHPQTIMPPDLILSVALVQIAIREYVDGNYWDSFKSEIGVDVRPSTINLVGQIFIATLKRYYLLFVR